MGGSGRTLRVSLISVKAQEPRRYHVSLQVLANGASLGDYGADETLRSDMVARTETAPLGRCPEFVNRAFVLRLLQPLGSSLCPQAALECSLLAAPSADSAPGVMVAGKEADELLGRGVVHIKGETASRLLRGERVTVAAPLQRMPVLQGFDGSQTQLLAASRAQQAQQPARDDAELLLELMLLDADAPLRTQLPGSTGGGTLRSSGGFGSLQGALAGVTSSATVGRGPAECCLLVMVSHAEGLPMADGADGRPAPPQVLVAAKSARDAARRLPAQAVTHASLPSQCPAWHELLRVTYPEADVQEEKLLLALVNDATGRLVAKASVPLADIVPGMHYSLALQLSPGARIYVSLCLTRAPAVELRQWQQVQPQQVCLLVQARLAGCSRPLQQLLADSGAGNDCDIWGIYRGGQPSTQLSQADVSQLYLPLDPLQEDAASSAIKDRSGRLLKGRAAYLNAVHLQHSGSSNGGEKAAASAMMWPPEHMVTLACTNGPETSCVTLELHSISSTAGSTTSTYLGSATLPASALTPESRGQLSVVEDVEIVLASATAGGASPATATFEVQAWDFWAYVNSLQLLAGPSDADLHTASTHWGENFTEGDSWQGRMGGGGQAGAAALEALVADCLAKQVAFERLQRQVDQANSQSELAAWRFSDIENRSRALQDENTHLRQLLHEEKEASRHPPALDNAAAMSREELTQHAESALAAFGRERRRNAELVYRLQQLHAQQVDVMELQRQYTELQEAHVAQSKLLTQQEGSAPQLAEYRSTIKTQESVIAKLEKLLLQAAQRAKQVPQLEADNAKLRSEVQRLLQEASSLPVVQVAAAEADEAVKRLVGDKDRERVAAIMRADKAEASATAAHNELMDVTKRYAREIAQLKTRLAEKDAQMMGGFGSLTGMFLGELPDLSTNHLNDMSMSMSMSNKLDPLATFGRHDIPGLGHASMGAGMGMPSMPTTSPGRGPGATGDGRALPALHKPQSPLSGLAGGGSGAGGGGGGSGGNSRAGSAKSVELEPQRRLSPLLNGRGTGTPPQRQGSGAEQAAAAARTGVMNLKPLSQQGKPVVAAAAAQSDDDDEASEGSSEEDEEEDDSEEESEEEETDDDEQENTPTARPPARPPNRQQGASTLQQGQQGPKPTATGAGVPAGRPQQQQRVGPPPPLQQQTAARAQPPAATSRPPPPARK